MKVHSAAAMQRVCEIHGSNTTSKECIAKLANKYNDQKATVGVKKWQLSDEAVRGIANLLTGTSEESIELLQAHLNFYKWNESGGLLELIKIKRRLGKQANFKHVPNTA